MTNRLLNPILIAAILFVCSLVFYIQAALNLPPLFNLDNQSNYAATRYIAENHKIPIVKAGDSELEFTEIGTTRSLRPPLTYIVSAFVSNLSYELYSKADVVNESIIRYRLGSALLGALTVMISFIGFWIAFNHIGLALFGSLAIGLLPKFLFLASSNNDDIGALLSVSLLFTSTLALLNNRDKNWSLIAVAFSIGLVLQTKYTAWLTLPWLGVFCLILIKPYWPKVVKIFPLLLLVCLLSGGWWLVFNMVHYGVTDPTALRQAAEIQRNLSEIEPNREGYASLEISAYELLTNYDQFLSKSYRSFIGYLEWLELDVGTSVYIFYGIVFLLGIIGVAFNSQKSHKETVYLDYLILIIILNQCLFYVHHNWLRDIQPQARYILPIIMPLLYLFLRLIQQLPQQLILVNYKKKELKSQTVISLILCFISLILFYQSWTQYIIPSYQAKPYYTSLDKLDKYNIRDALDILSSKSIKYQFVNETLELQRIAIEPAIIELNSSFCEILPLNALVIVDIYSPLSGSFDLRIDRNHNQLASNIIWQAFSAGNSTAILSVNSQNCTGAKISLSKNTHQLILSNLRITELKIHEYGKPI